MSLPRLSAMRAWRAAMDARTAVAGGTDPFDVWCADPRDLTLDEFLAELGRRPAPPPAPPLRLVREGVIPPPAPWPRP